MLPLVAILAVIFIALILGAHKWPSKSVKYIVIAITAVLQTVLILFYMFTMKVPTGILK